MNKHIVRNTIWLLTVVIFFSCRKNDIGAEPMAGGITIQPVGIPAGDAVSEIIGAEGGLITSQDGRVEVKIPAGALTEDTEIKIQALRNTAAGGLGYSYRLTPHGKIFKKNVTILFNYKKDERRISNTEALEIAYQNDEGIWICKGNAINDTTRKTIYVLTDHFSDWGLIPSMELTPPVKTVGLGESVTLKAVRYVHPDNENDFLIPLTIPDASMGQPVKLEQQYIVGWTLNGPGRIDIIGNEVKYTAPSLMPSSTTATVSVQLNVQGKQVLLISTIYIIDEGISLSIDGGPWQSWPGMATTLFELQQYTISSLRITPDVPQIVFLWPALSQPLVNGIYGWTMHGDEDNDVVFQYAEPDLQRMYVSIYEDGLDIHDSPGFISVEEIKTAGKKYLTGVFAIDKAGFFDNSTGEQIKISGIMGSFKVRMN